ncbi:hypothetical protein L6R29_18270 [Myxococcota bacterium]|nr:hypothetical protein [Myxococcota bacterium]
MRPSSGFWGAFEYALGLLWRWWTQKSDGPKPPTLVDAKKRRPKAANLGGRKKATAQSRQPWWTQKKRRQKAANRGGRKKSDGKKLPIVVDAKKAMAQSRQPWWARRRAGRGKKGSR